MNSNESSKSFGQNWKEDTAHTTPEARDRVLQALRKTEAARKARIEAAAKAREAAKGKAP
jgi:hypothetical protein